MKRKLAILMVALLLTGLGPGCGKKGPPGVNSNKDMPKPVQKP